MLDPKLQKYKRKEYVKPKIIGFADFNFFAQSLTNVEFNASLDCYDKIFCDGFWIYLLLRVKSYDVVYKPGPTFFNDKVLGLKKMVILSKYEKDDIDDIGLSASFSNVEFIKLPYKNNVLEFDYFSIAKLVKDKRHIFISLGCPKQEIFTSQLSRHLKNNPYIYTVGAAIDFFTGNEKRAPQLIRFIRMEYLWRLSANFKKQIVKWKKIPVVQVWFIKK